MTAVIAFILGFVFLIGGLVPNFAVGMLEQNISVLLNKPEKLEITIASTPSFGLLAGNLDRASITAERFVISGIMIDKMELTTGLIKLNLDKLISGEEPAPQNNIQMEIKCYLKEEDINNYLKSNDFNTHLQQIKQNIPSSIGITGDIDIKNVSIKLKEDKPEFHGEIKTMGGFFTLPLYLRLPSEDTLALLEPEIIIMDKPLPAPMLRELTDKLNPLIDLKLINTQELTFHFRSIEVKEGQLILTTAIQVNSLTF